MLPYEPIVKKDVTILFRVVITVRFDGLITNYMINIGLIKRSQSVN